MPCDSEKVERWKFSTEDAAATRTCSTAVSGMEQDANEECAGADRTFFISVINFLIFPYLPFKKINYKIC